MTMVVQVMRRAVTVVSPGTSAWQDRETQCESNQHGDILVPERCVMQVQQESTSGAVAHAMELDQLRSHIRTLITLEEMEVPIVPLAP